MCKDFLFPSDFKMATVFWVFFAVRSNAILTKFGLHRYLYKTLSFLELCLIYQKLSKNPIYSCNLIRNTQMKKEDVCFLVVP